MSEAVDRIVRLQRRVMWRGRLLSLQDELALAVTISALIGTVLVLLARLRSIEFPLWAVIIGVAAISVGAALIRQFMTRISEHDAAFLIDASLELDDRVATSSMIIERGGPKQVLEEALIEDTAERIGNLIAPSIVPFRVRRWYALVMISIVGIVASLMIPSRTLPASEAVATERANIENAGELLERTAGEVERIVPAGTEVAALAKEQAEVGRGFRHSKATRGEALKRLSALEERLRRRRDELANTHAEEIVDLADRRLGATLSTLSTARRKRLQPNESQLALRGEEPPGASKPGIENRVTPSSGGHNTSESSQEQSDNSVQSSSATQAPTKRDQSNKETKAKEIGDAAPRNRPLEPVSGNKAKSESVGSTPAERDSELDKARAGGAAEFGRQRRGKKGDELKTDGEISGEQTAGERNAEDKPPGEQPAGGLESLRAVPDSLAGQATKALPKISDELLKKAAEFRANDLSPGDIEKLRKAAELLSRDLAQFGQSRELQQALQEMARRIRPEQIEQVAQALGGQEKLKLELDAAVRLLAENQQAKEMVAGLADQLARIQDEKGQQDNQRGAGKSDLREQENRARNQAWSGTRGGQGQPPDKSGAFDKRLDRRGKESGLQGKLQKRPGGEYVYLQSKAGTGAARVPYASVYPQYRREAERSVQRTQVPPRLRAVVRKYFDAINPDAKK